MTIYYVATTGNDANGGTDPDTDAKLTIAAGVGLLAAGDTLRIVAGTYTLTSTVSVNDSIGGTTYQAATIIEGYRGIPVITSATNSVALFTTDTGTLTYFILRDVKLTHTAATRGVGLLGAGANASQPQWYLQDVEIDGCSNGVSESSRLSLAKMERVTIRNCTSHGASITNASSFFLTGCKFINNSGAGFVIATNANASPFIERCIFSGNTLDGFSFDASARNTAIRFMHCTFEGNGGEGLNLPVGSTGSIHPVLTSNVFWGNTNYGLEVGTNPSGAGNTNDNNAYGGNTSGDHTGWYDGDNKISLSVDPFRNAASENWEPNEAGTGGALLRGAGTNGADVGAVQHEGSTEGGAAVAF